MGHPCMKASWKWVRFWSNEWRTRYIYAKKNLLSMSKDMGKVIALKINLDTNWIDLYSVQKCSILIELFGPHSSIPTC